MTQPLTPTARAALATNPAVFDNPRIPLSHYLHGWPGNKRLGHFFTWYFSRDQALSFDDIASLRDTGRVGPLSPRASEVNAASRRIEAVLGPEWWWITIAGCREVFRDPATPECCCGDRPRAPRPRKAVPLPAGGVSGTLVP